MAESSDNKTLEREIDFHNQRFESGSDKRKVTGKYYILKKDLDRRFLEIVLARSAGKKVLEIGCGPNINTPHWINSAGECHAIDISEVAVRQAESKLGPNSKNATVSIMNAENMTYDDNYFDVVCGKGIIHHLNIEASWREVARVLKPDGIAVFIEPLGHNPVINAYRRRTPHMRSDDEHPLLMSDIDAASHRFDTVKVDYQNITTILSVFAPGETLKRYAYSMFNKMDRMLMSLFPFTRKYSWMVLITLEKSRR